MITHHGISGLQPGRFHRPVVTIGVFDGVHRGHRTLLTCARMLASRIKGELVVITFDVHPRAITTGRPPPLITSLRHRLVLLEREGVDQTIVLEFTPEMREMPAERFVEQILVERIGVQAVVMGYDSHFGHNREGNYELVRRMLAPRAIPVEQVDAFSLKSGEVVSSSAIREAVARSDLTAAARLLGRPPALYGIVVPGDGRGHHLGYPTANLDLEGELRPVRGVYGGWVLLDGRVRPAAVNIGGRPTFRPEGADEDTVEVHIVGYTGDLYGRPLEVFLLGRIRDERRFDSPDALRAQIDADLALLRARLATGEWSMGSG